MPIYEYQCQRCEHRFETLQGIHAAPLETCPSCGEPALVKLISAAAFRLKGSGWYETDFKNPKPKPKQETAGEKPKEAKKPAAGESSSGKPASSAPDA